MYIRMKYIRNKINSISFERKYLKRSVSLITITILTSIETFVMIVLTRHITEKERKRFNYLLMSSVRLFTHTHRWTDKEADKQTDRLCL